LAEKDKSNIFKKIKRISSSTNVSLVSIKTQSKKLGVNEGCTNIQSSENKRRE
jgi:hypothetical protein